MVTDDLSLEDFGEAILPVQYFELINRRKFLDGERHLLLAVLEEAARSYLTNMNCRNREQRIRFAEVRRWFYPRDEQQGLFAFESICDLLGIEANIFRRRLGSISLRDLPSRRVRWVPSVPGQRGHALRSRHPNSKTGLWRGSRHVRSQMVESLSLSCGSRGCIPDARAEPS